VKRKSTALVISDLSDDEEPVVPVKPQGARLKKGVVLSEDEGDEPKPKPKFKAKGKDKSKVKFEDSENEKSLREMMEIEDCQIFVLSYAVFLVLNL
jgi:hypothetical protein